MVFLPLLLYYKVADKFYELTNIRHNITSAYHPQANGEVERFNRTTQEAFLKCQEFHDEVIKADILWHNKLHGILLTYRTRKHASTKISPYMIMYGRECVMPWELDSDLGPLENEEDRDLPMEEVMEKMYNIREQVLDVAAANIKRAQKTQARSNNAKHCRNASEVGEKVWRKNPLWNTKQKSLKKGPKWHGPYEVAERKDGGNGNYLLMALSGKNKGLVSKNSCPPNHLKRFIHRNPEIPDDSDSEYGSDNEDSVPASQESGIGLQESVPENPSPIPSDAMTVLYPNPDEGDTLLGCTLIDDPGHTLPKMMMHIPICTPSCNDDDAFLPDLAETEPATPVPVHTERTLSAAEILADLAEGRVVSDHDESAQSLELQLEVSTTSEQQTKVAEEVDVVNTQEVDMENTQYEDQTMETIDVDLIVKGFEDLKPMMFYPFSLYMRKQVATTVNINVGRNHGLGLRVDALRYHGTGEHCTNNFNVHTVDGDGNCFFRSISYLLLGSEAKHDVVRSAVCNYIIQPENWYKLKVYIDGDITSDKEYVRKSEMHVWGKWATHVELCIGTAY